MRRICLLTLCALGSASAGHVSSPSGFSLDYPQGWRVVSPAELKEQAEEMNISSRHDRRVLVIVDSSGLDAHKSIQVSVYDEPRAVTEYEAKKLWDELLPLYEPLGSTPKLLQLSLHQVGHNKGISFEYVFEFPGVDEAVHYWSFWIPGNNRSYAVLFAGEASQFANHREKFADVLRSFQIEPVAEPSFISKVLTSRSFWFFLFLLWFNSYMLRRRRKKAQ